MPKVVINTCYGGFSLSKAGSLLYQQYAQTGRPAKRDDVHLVRVVETLGCAEAGSVHSALKIVNVPDDVEWTIKEYDGIEWVAEVHRTWS
jgi:hypothetical protein